MKWKVSMPREKPEAGKVSYVLAVKYSTGTRIEWSGKITEEAARNMVSEVAGPALLKALPNRMAKDAK